MPTVTRYHPVLVVLHWILAFMITAALALGALVMVHLPSNAPMKYEALRSHMIGGVLILVLMGLRFTIRQLTAIPAPAPTGNSLLDRLAKLSHRGFYSLVLAQVITGLVMAFQAHLPQILLFGHGTLPASFWTFPTRLPHYLISRMLMTLIAIHVAAALYHTFIRRDRLLRRMWFGKRLVPAGEQSLGQAQPTLQVSS